MAAILSGWGRERADRRLDARDLGLGELVKAEHLAVDTSIELVDFFRAADPVLQLEHAGDHVDDPVVLLLFRADLEMQVPDGKLAERAELDLGEGALVRLANAGH